MKLFRLTVLLLFITFSQIIFAQTTITGIVIEAETGEPIPGTSIHFCGTTLGTTTDRDGQFSISTLDGSETLVFSFVGLKTVKRKIRKSKFMEISLKSDAVIEEVVITAIGTCRTSYRTCGQNYSIINNSTADNQNSKNITDVGLIKEKEAQINIYPNPTADITNVQINGKVETIYLIDISGKILKQFETQDENLIKISLEKYPAGVYFIKYSRGLKWEVGKIIKTK